MYAYAYVVGVFLATGAVLYAAHRLLRVGDEGSWDDDAAALAREVRSVTGDPEADYGNVQRRLVPLASRIDGHLRVSPPDTDTELERHVRRLGAECRAIGMEHPHRDRSATPLSTKLDALDETARAVQEATEDDTEE